MILSDKGIGTYVVGQALGGVASTDYGVLCTHPSINVWSKWKPVSSGIDTMTTAELKRLNYGIQIVRANNLTDLIGTVNSRSGIGYSYDKPGNNFRIGDFRNYNSDATLPVATVYGNGEVIKIGGAFNADHGPYERIMDSASSMSTDTTLGADELYTNFRDRSGNLIQVHRGAIITFADVRDGTDRLFMSRKFEWWSPNVQKFAGKDVFVYEVYTNAEGSNANPYNPKSSDMFFALPYCRYKLTISVEEPPKRRVAFAITNPTWFIANDGSFEMVRYSLSLSSEGPDYLGGSVTGLEVRICQDREGKQILARDADFPEVSLGVDEVHRVTSFRTIKVLGNTNPNLWFVVYFNKEVQYSSQPAYDVQIAQEMRTFNLRYVK